MCCPLAHLGLIPLDGEVVDADRRFAYGLRGTLEGDGQGVFALRQRSNIGGELAGQHAVRDIQVDEITPATKRDGLTVELRGDAPRLGGQCKPEV